MLQDPPSDQRTIEVRVNTFTKSIQANPSIASDADGNLVVAWESRRQELGSSGIFAQRLDPLGRPIGTEIHVNQFAPSQQTAPAVAVGLGDRTWIAWESFGQDGNLGGIVARPFVTAADGTLVAGEGEFLVNTTRHGHQSSPAIAVDAYGDVVFTWVSAHGERPLVMARALLADGTFTEEWTVGAASAGRESQPSVACLGDDQFVVAWARTLPSGKPGDALVRRVSASAGPWGEEVRVNDRDGLPSIEPAVASDSSGRFVVGWMRWNQTFEAYDVCARRFDGSLSPLGATQVVARPQTWLSGVTVAMAADGRYLVSYNVEKSEEALDTNPERPSRRPTPSDVWAQRFDAAGVPIGAAWRVNGSTAGRQSLEIGSAGSAAFWSSWEQVGVVWSGKTGRGDDEGVALSLCVPASLNPPAPREVPPLAAAQDLCGDEVYADATIPPEYDPFFVPEPPDPDTRSNGPDFGFIAFQNTGWYPPDPDIAVGPDHIVVVVNGGIRFFTHSGTQQFSDEIAGSGGFWGAQGAGGFVFDPIAVYDHYAGRFVVGAAEQTGGNSYLLLAVSDNSDPNGTWAKYRFNVTSYGGDFVDFPNLGLDDEAYYFTADFFSSPGGNWCFIINKTPTLSGQPVTPSAVRMSTGFLSLGNVNNYDGAGAAVQYFVTSYGSAGRVRLYAITNPLTSPTISSFTFTSPTFSQPPDAPQLGTSNLADTIDYRIKNAVLRNGSLWACHTIGQGGVARVRWYQIQINNWPFSGSPTMVQYGSIDPGSGIYTWGADVAVDDFGDAFMAFNRSSSSEYISVQRAYRVAGDTPGTFQAPVALKESTSPETGDRWGDYSGVDEVPDEPGVFWAHTEYRTNSWRTWAGRVAVPTCPGPQIVEQPADFDGCTGGDAVLDIVVSTPGVTYQWRRGSTNLVDDGRISGATTSVLTISDLQASDAATDYNCLVSTETCPISSGMAAITVAGPAEFLNQPVDANAPEGGTAAFNVLVLGWQDYTFQWRRNGVPLTDNGRISGATTQGLLIDPVQLSDAGTYDCLATSAAGCETLSNSATLTVVAQCTQAQITQQPANQTACSGDTVALSVSATGTSLGYQWRRGTTNLSNDGHFSGVTTPTLTISNAVPGDSGTDYNCVVTSGGSCPVTSNNATVTINAYPSITQQPGSSSVCEGGTIMLSVGATGGSLSYQWRRGTTNLNDGGRISGATTATLTIVSALPSDAGNDYNCVVTSGGLCTVASDDGTVEVGIQPAIVEQPQDLTVDEGDNASFTVTVQNPGSYTYRWRKDGNDLSDGGSISGSGTSSLLITGVVQGDAGDYDCVISGTLCDVVSAAATLTVNAPEPCPEDLDGDGVVGLPDLSILLTNFGGPGTAAEGDITGDGQVDLADLSALLTAYGTTCP